MWKGLKKALGKPGKLKKCSLERYALDSSTRSTSSAAPSVVFPLDLADADAVVAWHDQQQQHAEQEQQLPHIGLRAGGPAGPDPLTASQIQQHLQQQLVVQQLMQRTDDHSASKRQAAALQKRIDNQMLNPSTCLYQISSLLSLSTLFEHKVSSRLRLCCVAVACQQHRQQNVLMQQFCLHAAAGSGVYMQQQAVQPRRLPWRIDAVAGKAGKGQTGGSAALAPSMLVMVRHIERALLHCAHSLVLVSWQLLMRPTPIDDCDMGATVLNSHAVLLCVLCSCNAMP